MLSVSHFAEFVKTERKKYLMNAYRCDFCGELYVRNREIRIKSLAGIYYTHLLNVEGKAIDICDCCRCKIQETLDALADKRDDIYCCTNETFPV